MTEQDFSANIERFTGFASQYDEVRPSPPMGLAELLLPMAKCETPSLVVDLGSGTGLSTRYWGPLSEAVVGVDPTDTMRDQAERIGGQNISYRRGFSHETGLRGQCADLVICAQSLHWMEPDSTFAEAARILRNGGVFAAYDYDWPPSTSHWEVDLAYRQCAEHALRLEKERGMTERLRHWDKSGHLDRIRASGRFRFARECLLSHRDKGGAERFVGLFLSQGFVRSLLKAGVSECELQIDFLRETARRAFAGSSTDWHWSARVRIGVK